MRFSTNGDSRPRKRDMSVKIRDAWSRPLNRSTGAADQQQTPITRLDSSQNTNESHSDLRERTLPKEPVRERIHDIMSPLNAVSGYVDLLQANAREPGAVDRLERYSQKIAQGLEQISDQLEELQHFCQTNHGTGRMRRDREEIRRSIQTLVAGISV